MTYANRIIDTGQIDPKDIVKNSKNWRRHPENQIDAMAGVLDDIGWIQDVIINQRTGRLVDGHLRVDIAIKNSEQSIPVKYVDLSEEEEETALLTLDPISAMAEADKELLENLMASVSSDSEAVNKMMDDLAKEHKIATTEEAVEDDYEPPAEIKTDIKRGDLILLGRHRLLCGDATNADDVERLIEGKKADMLLTDPPYCSGGFQEAGKKSGSIGTRGTEMISNDTLSTRGYQSLIKSVLNNVDVGVIYIFTDWRMWINLFDISESSGYGVRNMIVWDKGTPGMGVGWRSQHELILCGVKVTSPFSREKAQGNVIQCNRTGNINHPTEKPVELITKIFDVNDICHSVYDPFLGSGTTLIAAEQLDRTCYGMEISPQYCEVICQRFEKATGIKRDIQ